MDWNYFYTRWSSWAYSTLTVQISKLKEIGSVQEVVEIAVQLGNERLANKLVRKAMQLGAVFFPQHILQLAGKVSMQTLRDLYDAWHAHADQRALAEFDTSLKEMADTNDDLALLWAWVFRKNHK